MSACEAQKCPYVALFVSLSLKKFKTIFKFCVSGIQAIYFTYMWPEKHWNISSGLDRNYEEVQNGKEPYFYFFCGENISSTLFLVTKHIKLLSILIELMTLFNIKHKRAI